MECKTCHYPLWNLKSRACPECGDAFRPSDFAFRPGTVRFMCPHCDQPYYGTDADGHLVPRSFACVSCDTPVTMDEMVLLPAEGVSEAGTARFALPWLDRPKHGFWKAWWKTTTMSMIRPGELIAARDDASSLGAAWGYFFVTFGFIMIVGALIGTLVFAAIAAILSNAGGMPPGFIGTMAFMQILGFAFAIVASIIFLVIWALATHVLLRITGETAGTVRTTFHALLYGSGPNVLSAIPCLNQLPIGSVWWVVSSILMIKRGHGVSGVRASFAVLALPITTIALFVVGYIALIAAIMATATPGTGLATVASSHPQMEALANAAEDHAAQRGAGWDNTDHALLLLAEGYVNALDYIAVQTPTTLDAIPLREGLTLDDFTIGAGTDVSRVARLFDPLPPDVVAHRVGDFVFTWHGIDAANPPAELWLIIEHDLSDAGIGAEPCYARRADGVVVTLYPNSSFTAQRLQDQNDARAAHNLPPLPDPTTVTQQEPATAGP